MLEICGHQEAATLRLHRLLHERFDADELRAFLSNLPDAQAVARSLPGAIASHEQLVTAAVQLLERHGLLNREFFSRLIHARPRRASDIREVARALAIDVPDSMMVAAETGTELDAMLREQADTHFVDHLVSMTRHLPHDHPLVHRVHLMIADLRQHRRERKDGIDFSEQVAVPVFELALALATVRPPASPSPEMDASGTSARMFHAAIIEAVQENDGERAVKRLLDFTRMAGPRSGAVNRATLLAATLHDLGRRFRYTPMPQEARNEWHNSLGRILELADETLVASTELDRSMAAPRPSTHEEGGRFHDAREAFSRARHHPQNLAHGHITVRAHAISKRLSGRPGSFVLRDLSLDLRAGEITGLVGPNGSGKTTLLRIIAGELSHDAGVLTYPGLDPRGRPGRPDWTRIRPRIGYVAQRPPRWPGRLAENLHRWAALYGIYGDANRDEVEFYLHRLDLERFRNCTWSEISGGYQMRFELARVLCGSPQLLVLDEPLAPLDLATQNLYLQDLRDLASTPARPIAVVVSSQHIYEIETIADYMLSLGEEGAVQYSGPARATRTTGDARFFELEADLTPQHLDDLRATKIVRETRWHGRRLLLSTPTDTSAADLVDWLRSKKIDIIFFQDISGPCLRIAKWGQ